MPSSNLRTLLLIIGIFLNQATEVSSSEQCDELLCRSPALYGGYGCWALVGSDPTPSAEAPLCDGDYVAVAMENVQPVDVPEYGGFFYYYTCCPSTTDISTFPAETEPFCTPYYDGFCGDQYGDCIVDGHTEPMSCLDEIYKYPHKIRTKTLYESQYRCCKYPPKAIQSTEASSAEQFSAKQCDELLCRSPALYGGYGCWALVGSDPTPSAEAPLCDGDYVAVAMENVQPVDVPEYGGFFYYYTCCPSTTDISTFPAETEPFCTPYYDGFCGDQYGDCIVDGHTEPMSCLDEIYKYPHKIRTKTLYESQYRCCKYPPKAIQSTEASSAEQFSAKQFSAKQCNELLCRSPTLYGGYGCWALGVSDPTPSAEDPLCDGDYVAVAMENVQPEDLPEYGGFFYYYTCCPSTTDISTFPAETEPFCTPYYDGFCGDWIEDCVADGPGDPMVCSDDIYKYPHRTGVTLLHDSFRYSQYRCCKDPPEHTHSNIFVQEIFRVVFATISSFFIFTIVAGILLSKSARKQPFNLYVVFATLGDFLYSLLSILVGSYAASQTYLPNTCVVFLASIHFSIFSGLWMSAVTIWEILKILLRSKQALRSPPPTIRKVIIQVFLVYLFTAGVSTFIAIMRCHFRVDTFQNGLSHTSLIAITTTVMIIPPVIYVLYASIRVWKQQLLPKTGRTRFLYIYFLRIAFITMMGLPMLGLILTIPYNIVIGVRYIISFAFFIIGWINLFFVLTKPDVRQASKMLWTCRCFSDDVSRESVSCDGKGLASSTFSLRFSSRFPSRFPSRFGSTEFRDESSVLARQKKSTDERNETKPIRASLFLKNKEKEQHNETNRIDTVGVAFHDDIKEEISEDDFLDPPKDSPTEPSGLDELSTHFR